MIVGFQFTFAGIGAMLLGAGSLLSGWAALTLAKRKPDEPAVEGDSTDGGGTGDGG